MENQQKKTTSHENSDIDLGTVFHMIAKGLRSFRRALRDAIEGIGQALMVIFIFLKRRMWWLLGAVVIGFGWGLYNSYTNGSSYYASMTAKYNFGSVRALYTSIDYLNALIGKRDLKELSRLLGITENEASSLEYFRAEPVKDEISVSELYKDQFLSFDRSDRIRRDTFWTKTIPYEQFKKNLTAIDYPLQKVFAVSRQADIFSKIQEGVIKCISSANTLKENQEIIRQMQDEEEKILVSSLNGLDTLRTVYNERLRQQPVGGQEPSTTNLNVLEKSLVKQSPELELYDKMLEIKDELRSFRNNNMRNRDLVQVYAAFSPVGVKVGILRQSAPRSAFSAFVLVLIILIAIEGYKMVSEYEKKHKNKLFPKG